MFDQNLKDSIAKIDNQTNEKFIKYSSAVKRVKCIASFNILLRK